MLQKKHVGTKNVKAWIDSDEWHQNFHNYDILTDDEKDEVNTAMVQASGGLFLRIWEEISKLFLDYLKYSKERHDVSRGPLTSL